MCPEGMLVADKVPEGVYQGEVVVQKHVKKARGRMRVLREEAGGVVVCGVLIGVEGGLGRVHSGTAVAAQAEGRESGRWERHCTFYSPLYS